MSATSHTDETIPVADRVFTVPEAAKYLRVSRWTIYELIKAGSVIPFHIGTRTLFNGGELLRFVAASQAKR